MSTIEVRQFIQEVEESLDDIDHLDFDPECRRCLGLGRGKTGGDGVAKWICRIVAPCGPEHRRIILCDVCSTAHGECSQHGWSAHYERVEAL